MEDRAAFDEIAFEVDADEAGSPQIRVMINGTDLVDLIGTFERGKGFDPAGGYGGLIPAYYEFGPMSDHFLGAAERRKVPVLGCECGEWGCWALMARIEVDDEQVRWSEFGQGHRPKWDYSSFGPLVFRRVPYEVALRDLEDQLRRTS